MIYNFDLDKIVKEDCEEGETQFFTVPQGGGTPFKFTLENVAQRVINLRAKEQLQVPGVEPDEPEEPEEEDYDEERDYDEAKEEWTVAHREWEEAHGVWTAIGKKRDAYDTMSDEMSALHDVAEEL